MDRDSEESLKLLQALEKSLSILWHLLLRKKCDAEMSLQTDTSSNDSRRQKTSPLEHYCVSHDVNEMRGRNVFAFIEVLVQLSCLVNQLYRQLRSKNGTYGTIDSKAKREREREVINDMEPSIEVPIEATYISSTETPAPGQRSRQSVSQAKDVVTLERIWVTSQNIDDVVFRPRDGWWSLSAWATTSRLLLKEGRPIGVVAMNVLPEEENAEARLALLPAFRDAASASLLVDQALVMAYEAGVARVRLSIPSVATWAIRAVQQRSFSLVRTRQVMVYPALIESLPVRAIDGIHIRPLREGEELALLDALNHAWANTWNFRPLTRDVLLSDLKGQQDGFFVAVRQTDETKILGTIHALFDRQARNPDEHPYAWISNLTVDPSLRGQGLGRSLLMIALNHLHRKGATSVALGVDGGAVPPVTLYHSTGFEVIGTEEIWEQNA